MRKLGIISLLLTSLGGCTTSMENGYQLQTNVEKVDYKNYVLGNEHKAYVGEQVIARKAFQVLVSKDQYQSQNSFTLKGGLGSTAVNLNASQGETFRIAGKNELGNPVVNIPGSKFMFGIDENGHWDKTVMSASFWTSPIGSGSQYEMNPANTYFKAVESQRPVSENGYVNHEIVFTGVGQNGISFLYREYTFENMARSAYKQEIVYPTDSREIRFRNYQLKIVSISPSEIQYVVVTE